MTKADVYLVNEIKDILAWGTRDENPRPRWHDGTPAHTISINHCMRKYNLDKEFPITTLRPMAWKTGIKEIFWIYQMQSNRLDDLHSLGIKYWDDWESKIEPGTIGHRYGYVVNKYNLIDNLLRDLKSNPFSRRHIMDLYQYEDLDETDGLYPCAFLTEWSVRKDNGLYYLDMVLFQRSGDLLTASGAGGINEIQYAALQLMIAKACGYEPGIFTHFVANEQIYDRHVGAAETLVERSLMANFNKPRIVLNTNKTDFYKFNIDDFSAIDYKPIKPQIKLEVAV